MIYRLFLFQRSTYRRYQFQFPREYFSSPGDCQIISYCSQEYLVQNYHRPLQIHFSFPRSTWPAYIPFWFRSVFAGEKFKTAYRKGRWEKKKIYIQEKYEGGGLGERVENYDAAFNPISSEERKGNLIKTAIIVDALGFFSLLFIRFGKL